MINERTIQWGSHTPTNENIKTVLDDFLAISFNLDWQKDRWIITLVGKPTDGILKKESFIEICPPKNPGDSCTINTQHSDPITEALANGIAKYIAYRLAGKQVYFCLTPLAKR